MVNDDKKAEKPKAHLGAEEPEDIAAPESSGAEDPPLPPDPGALSDSPGSPSDSKGAWAGGDKAERAAALEAELSEMTDRWKRAAAEAENTRRRLQREKEESVRYAAAGFAKDLLSVADNLHRALDSVAEDALAENEALKALHDGVALVERELLGAFERNGVAPIEALGAVFDPNLHEAMFEVPDESAPSGTVVQLLQPGYRLHERLLRAAMVGVAKGGPPAKVPAEEAETETKSGEPGETVDETA